MAKKIVVVQKKQGCAWLCGMLLLVCLIIAALVYALSIAAGVALWFGIRYVWRRLCIEAPESSIVHAGNKLPPIGRKVLAGIVCALVSICLIGMFFKPSEQTQEQQAAQTQTEVAVSNDTNGSDLDVKPDQPASGSQGA